MKKVILFIVEGQSEEDALGSSLSRLLTSSQVSFHIVGGDITSDRSTTLENVVTKVHDQIKQFLDKSHFRKSDLLA
jgi:hypothetical protein